MPKPDRAKQVEFKIDNRILINEEAFDL